MEMVIVADLSNILLKAAALCYERSEEAGQSGGLDLSDSLDDTAKEIGRINNVINQKFHPGGVLNQMNTKTSFNKIFKPEDIQKIQEAIKLVSLDIDRQRRALENTEEKARRLTNFFDD